MENITENVFKNFLSLRIKRDVSSLYLKFLFLLENLKNENRITEEEFLEYRKEVLDLGNDTVRNLNGQLDDLDISLHRHDKQDETGNPQQ